MDGRDVDVVVTGEHIDGDNGGDAVDLHVLELLAEVVAALVHLFGVGLEQCLGQRFACDDLVVAGVGLETANRCHKDRGVGGDAGVAALDVEEPLGAHVGAEPGFGQQEVAGVDTDLVGND